MKDWQDMIAEFRALGGVAENLRLGHGALGRGLFAIDPARPVRIHVPESLLVDSADVAFENGALTVGPAARTAERERRFIEAYHARFGWGEGGRAEIAQVLDAAQALPADLRRRLLSEFRCGPWFEEASEGLVQRQFLASRQIGYGARTVIMPVLDLANHGGHASFRLQNGIVLQATTADEVLVGYTDMDSYGLFLSWGFAAEQKQALSIGLLGNVGPAQLKVDRLFAKLKAADRVGLPDMARQAGGGVALDFLMIGNRNFPRLARGIFYKRMREAGLSGAEEAFDLVHHANRMHFLGLIGALEDVEGAMADTLRRMARMQLQAMSYAWGARAV
ncbi:MAG TPA: hypothetical protein VG889_08465 [Rhizomicrobium sp.]|nr:hypothetical protein [Rhizomicrobium sp.]